MKILNFLLVTATIMAFNSTVSAKSNTSMRPKSSSNSGKYVACEQNSSLELVARSTKIVKDTADKYFGKNSFDAQQYANKWVEKHPCEFAANLYHQAKIATVIIDTYYEGVSPLEADFLVAMIADDICLNKNPIEGARKLYQTAQSQGLSVSESNEFVRTQFRARGFRSHQCKAPYIY